MDLIFPTFEAKLIKRNGKPYIFDVIRKKHIFLTPEEWIRQHCIHFLINNKNYPKSILSVERSHVINSRIKRSDLIAYNRNGHPYLLIEFKAPEVPINQLVLNQATLYNQTINAEYIVLTNGLDLLCAQIRDNEIVYSADIPVYPESDKK